MKKKQKKYKAKLKTEFIRADKCTYGYAGGLPEGDKRHVRYKKQREKRGFDNTELWSLEHSIVKFVYPRLKEFRRITPAYPSSFDTQEEWLKVLDKILIGFKAFIDVEGCFFGEKKSKKKFDEGFKVFTEYFLCLWY